jgi:hypothetical protein
VFLRSMIHRLQLATQPPEDTAPHDVHQPG